MGVHRFLFVIIAMVVFSAPYSASAQDEDSPDNSFFVLKSKAENMKNAGLGPVLFPHLKHGEKMDCSACHEKIFIQERGANDISMKSNMEGNFCGACHDGRNPRAFALFNCNKCHQKLK